MLPKKVAQVGSILAQNYSQTSKQKIHLNMETSLAKLDEEWRLMKIFEVVSTVKKPVQEIRPTRRC
jgi:hypothetical protein